ncbi:MAG: hypothetical protein PHD29_06225 [bacterium]|nr:hypothetical protein [bacterium]
MNTSLIPQIKKNFVLFLLLISGVLACWCPVALAAWGAFVPNPIMEYHYTYDNNGNITDIYNAVAISTSTFTYDEIDRLTSAIGPYGTQNYTYDSLGNNTDSGITPYTDNNGNATSYNGKTIEYDYENRPIKITDTAKNTISEFAYDYSGQRVYTKVSSGTLTREDYYVGNIYEESYSVDSSSPIISASTTTVTYVYAGSMRVAGLTAQTTSTGTENNTLYYHGDHLGSSSIITDGTGTVVRDISYQPWGNVDSNTEESGANTLDPKHKFTGQILDDSTELYYYGARYYDPILRRFISPDTQILDPYNPQELNRYAYCVNNPLRYTDPSGYSWFSDNWREHKWFRIAVITIGSAALGGIGGAWIAPGLSKVGFSFAINGVTISASGGAVAGAIAGATGGLITQSYMEFGRSPDNSNGNDKLRLANGLSGAMTPLDEGNGNVVEGNSNEIFVNGVLNYQQSDAQSNAGSSTLVYNSSRGAVYDLLEAGVMKLTRGTWDKATRVLANEIVKRYGSLRPGENLTIRAHSQGKIILANALYIAQSQIEDRSRIEIKTYGGASWTFPKDFNATHYGNRFDPVYNLFGGGNPLNILFPNLSSHPMSQYYDRW